MKFDLQRVNDPSNAAIGADVFVLFVNEAQARKSAKVPKTADSAKNRMLTPAQQVLAQAIAAEDFSGSCAQVLHSYLPAASSKAAARRLLLVGTGTGTAVEECKAAQAALAACAGKGIKHVALAGWQSADAVVQGSCNGAYRYDSTLSKKNPSPPRCTLLTPEMRIELQEQFALATSIAAGSALAKEWANRPANYATPTHLAEAAQTLARGSKAITCKVMGSKEVEKLKMGAFLSVAQGSTQPLKFIELRYQGAASTKAPVVLVGKGITFDTGGISLKPGAEMDEMKFDMCGAASVLGVFAALKANKPKINVVGLIPACENMPAGNATKPGDVVTSMSGQTIEILNTDAEGRLILCDVLTYAQRFKPRALIDIATLTGACVIALGGVRSGLFSNDDGLALQLQTAGTRALDECWRMPLDEDYAEGLKSRFADMANVAGRAAGSVTAAKFLQKFVGTTAWAHLDIAGTAWKSGMAKGATGRPVPLLMHYLIHAQ